MWASVSHSVCLSVWLCSRRCGLRYRYRYLYLYLASPFPERAYVLYCEGLFSQEDERKEQSSTFDVLSLSLSLSVCVCLSVCLSV